MNPVIATLVGLILFLLIGWVALGAAIYWGDQQTLGGNYFLRPLAERRRFRTTLRRQASLLAPVLWVLRPFSRFDFSRASFRAGGVTGPLGNCSPQSFETGMAYQPRPEDVFVATQMKCGTTWMLHLVYQVLLRGRGDLVETGRALHGVSPWLEGNRTVTLAGAPAFGAGRTGRIIKTHFPASHCPWSDAAKYIYVARHPAACFASCVDFVAENTGPHPPGLAQFESWFTSEEQMWWGTWPDHVRGWWDRAEGHPNVLFVHFEDMRRDLPAVVREVAAFLGVAPLLEEEVAEAVRKCSFSYMREHAEAFEMHPPHLGAVEARLFRKGTADRHLDVPEDLRRRIGAWAAAAMAGSSYPLHQHYPDLT